MSLALTAWALPVAQAANDAYAVDAGGNFSTSFTLGTTTPTAGGTSSPASGDSLFFGTETTGSVTPTNDLTGFTFAGITFNAGASAFTIGGNAFTLTTGITNTSSVAQTINNAIVVSGANAITLNGGGTSGLTLGGNLTGGGTLNQTGVAAGVSQLNLGGDNSGFTGIFTQDNATSTRTGFATATAGSAAAAWTFNRAVGGGTVLNFGTGTINFGSLAGGSFIRNNTTGTTSTLSVGALNTSTTFSGQIQGNGTALLALTKVGTGTLSLTGANTYTGTTTVANGTVVLGGTSTSGTTAVVLGDATANTSGVLQLGDASGASNLTTLTSLTTAGTGTANAVVGGNAAVSTLTLTNAAAVTYGGVLGGAGTNQNSLGLTKAGAGNLTLTGINTYSGATQINAGTLSYSGAGSSANSAITLGAVGGGATTTQLTLLPSTTSGTVTRGAGLTTNGNNGTGNNYVNITQTGVAANTADQFTGALNLNSGATRLTQTSVAGGNVLLSFGSVTRNTGTVLNVSNAAGANTIASQTSNSQNIQFTTAPTLVGGGGAIGTTTTSILPYAIVSTTLATYDSTNGLRPLTTFGSVVDGTATQVNASNLTNGAVITVNSTAAVNSLTLGGSPTAVQVNGTGTLTITSGAINLTQANIFNVATLDFGAAEGFIYVQNTRLPVINSVITGSGGLTVNFNDINNTTARLVLNGANTYTGLTSFTGNNATQAVLLTNSLALQNTTLDYNNYGASFAFGNGTTTGQTAYTFGGLRGGQNINLNNNNATVGAVALTIGSAGSVDTASTVNTYSGVLSSTVTGGSIVKAGVATQVFSGANTYDGGTSIVGGKLRITNTTGSATGTGAVNLSGGTTTTLAGTGFSTGLLTVTAGSRLAPGVNVSGANGNFGAAGTLTLGSTGGLTLTSASLDFDLSTTAGVSALNDRIATGGTLTLGTLAFTFNELNGALATGATYTLISGGTVAGFNAANISTTIVGATTYTAAYSTDATDLFVTFTAAPVPEPGTWAMLVSGFGLVTFLRYRRRGSVLEG